MTSHLSATRRHLPYGMTQYYLPPDTSELAPPNRSQSGRYSIYLPRRDGRLSRPKCFVMYTEMVYPPADGHPSKY